jgi:non-canonical poly(A) RNA polymerase PAPD5/7
MEFFRWIDPVLRAHKVIPFPDAGLAYLDSHQPPPDDPRSPISTRLSNLIKGVLPTRAAVLVREHIIRLLYKRIPAAVSDFGQSHIVAACGSSLSGTSLPESDIDLVLFIYPLPANAAHVMERLQQDLADLARPDTFLAIPQAKVPILKFTVEPGIQIDLVIDELQGPLYVSSIRHLFNAFPVLLPVQIFMKCVLRKHQLDQPYTGGIASYTLQLMILAYLQQRGESPFLVDFIRGFCEFYGSEFNFTLTGIDVTANGRLFCRMDEEKLCLESPKTMHIVDPFNRENVLGHNAFKIMEFRAVLMTVCEVIVSGSAEKWDAEFEGVLADAALRQSFIDEHARINELA